MSHAGSTCRNRMSFLLGVSRREIKACCSKRNFWLRQDSVPSPEMGPKSVQTKSERCRESNGSAKTVQKCIGKCFPEKHCLGKISHLRKRSTIVVMIVEHFFPRKLRYDCQQDYADRFYRFQIFLCICLLCVQFCPKPVITWQQWTSLVFFALKMLHASRLIFFGCRVIDAHLYFERLEPRMFRFSRCSYLQRRFS